MKAIEGEQLEGAVVDAEQDEVYEFLDMLRESGATTMFGAAPYIQKEFSHRSAADACAYLLWWMKNLPKASDQ